MLICYGKYYQRGIQYLEKLDEVHSNMFNPTILGDVLHVCWLGEGVSKFTYPYDLLKYFSKRHQIWQF